MTPSSLTFRLSTELRQRLEAEAHATGKSLAEITTEALTGWLDSGGFGARLTRLEETVHLVMLDTRQRDPGPLGLVMPDRLRKVTPDTRPPTVATPEDPEGWLTTREAFMLSRLPEEQYRTWQAQLSKGRLSEWERHPDPERRKGRLPWLRLKH